MMALDAAGKTPDDLQRTAFYNAVRPGADAAMARSAARLFSNALQRYEAVPEDLHWRVATLLRQAGDWRAAVEAASVLYSRPGLKERTRLYLASTMVGALLDLAAGGATTALMAEAERALKIACALDKGNETLRTMWRTLDNLRGQDAGRR